MKKPILSKLPFHLNDDCGYLDIEDSENVIIATINSHHNLVKDAEYIVEACNNYPKAIELLKEIQQEVCFFKTKDTQDKLNNFLKHIENDTE